VIIFQIGQAFGFKNSWQLSLECMHWQTRHYLSMCILRSLWLDFIVKCVLGLKMFWDSRWGL